MLALAAAGLAGCATAPVLIAPGSDEAWPELEPLLGVKLGRDALTVQMSSRGCAARTDIVFRVDRTAGHAVVAFARRRLETCRGPVGAVELRFGYDELGLTRGERIVIANPIFPPP